MDIVHISKDVRSTTVKRQNHSITHFFNAFMNIKILIFHLFRVYYKYLITYLPKLFFKYLRHSFLDHLLSVIELRFDRN